MKKISILLLCGVFALPMISVGLNARWYGDGGGWKHKKYAKYAKKEKMTPEQKQILAEGKKFDIGEDYQGCVDACRAHHMNLLQKHKLPQGFFRDHGQPCWKTCGRIHLNEDEL